MRDKTYGTSVLTKTPKISAGGIGISWLSLSCPSAKRFEENAKPYTAEEISEECQIPIRLTHQILYELQEINLLHEVVDENNEDIGYQPSMDINKMNVALLLDRLDTHGSEDFKIDKDKEFSEQWEVLMNAREEYYKSASHVLLKDL